MKKVYLIFLLVFLGRANAQYRPMVVGDSLYALGNYTMAINEYAKEGSPQAELQIARAYNAIGNYDKALAQYENLVHKNGAFTLAKHELGKLYLKLKMPVMAEKTFSLLIADNKFNPEYFYYRGEAMREVGRFDEGMAAYKNAVKIDSAHLRSLFQLGKYYVLQRKLDSVVKYVDKGLRFYENDVGLINIKALAYYNHNRPRLALPLFEKLVELGEDKAYIHEKMGHVYLVLNKFKEAKAAYFHLLEFDGEDPVALYGIGNAYWKLQERDSAETYIKKSIEVQKVVLDKEYNALARLAMEDNNIKLAIDYYRLAFQEDPSGYLYKYEICILTDQYYKDPNISLKCYREYQQKFGAQNDYFSEFAAKRISELNVEIHMKAQ